MQYAEIAQRVASVTEWDALPAHAEAHGLAPLAYQHLTAIQYPIPHAVKRELHALAARHRLASEARTHVLHDILTRYRTAGVQVMLLKGAALAYLTYPDPSLRPMRDIDLLVRKSDALNAKRVLGELGFDVPASDDFEHRHLGEATKEVDGFTITVEVHHNLFEKGSSPLLMGIDELASAPFEFSVGGEPTATLGYEDMLWYLCQHLVESTNVFSCVGLLWVADVVNFAEQFATSINWRLIQEKYPLVLNTLSLLHWLTPLSQDLITRASIPMGYEPRGMWEDFRKSPRTSPEAQFQQGYSGMLHQAFFPSEWWLRLYFGVGSARPLLPWHYARHLLYLSARFLHVARRRRNQRSK